MSVESGGGPLTPRESELLKKAGERVFALSRRLAERERDAERLTAESATLRELLSESKVIREILSSQVTSLQADLEREHEERAELRRLLASLHLQVQEMLPLLLSAHRGQETIAAPQPQPGERAPQPEPEPAKKWSSRMKGIATRELRVLRTKGNR